MSAKKKATIPFFKKALVKIRKPVHFLKNLVAPDNVTWPSFSDSCKNTVAVISVSIVFAVLLILMDTMFSLLLRIPYLF